MKYEQLSKIALATGADYANDPQNYNPDNSWNTAIEEQFGDLAAEMKLFASYSQHLEKNDWAKIGRPNAELPKSANELKTLKKALKRLKSKLPANILAECQPQLEELEHRVDNALREVSK